MKVLCLAFLSCGLALGQAKKPQGPPELEAFFSTALSFPAEYAADLVFDVLEHGAVKDNAWKIELLEEVFRRASGAKNAYSHCDVSRPLCDSSPVVLGGRLDTLSVQCRVVERMLLLSRKRARELFDEIPPIRLSIVPCKDPRIYDVSIYYRTLAALYNNAFTDAERKREEDVDFVRAPFQALTGLEQFAPASAALRAMNLPPALRRELTMRLAEQLPNAAGNDRQFTYADNKLKLSKEIMELGGGEPVIAVYRKLLLAHRAMPRCADAKDITESIKFFNESMVADVDASRLRITDDPPPREVSDAAVRHPLTFPDFGGLIGRLGQRQNGDPERNVDEDNALDAQAADFLEKLERSEDDPDGCKGCGFQVKEEVYMVFIDRLRGPVQAAALEAYLALLARDPRQFDSPMDWISAVKGLLLLTRTMTPEDEKRIKEMQAHGYELNMLPSPNAAKILESARRGGNPFLAAYAWAESIAPRPYDASHFYQK